MTDQPTPLVSTEWLAAHLRDRNLVLFDCSYYLPTENKDAVEEFESAHIPGAQFFDVDEVADEDSDLPHMLPSAGRFEYLAGEMGVNNDSFVVFYDQKGVWSAPRGWWMFTTFGHDRVAVLDGGLPKWLREGRKTQSGAGSDPKEGRFRATPRLSRVRGIGDMIENLSSGAELVLDARAAGRFDGSVKEPRPGIRGGHIPGARSLPMTELLGPDLCFLPPDKLRARFAAAGVDGGKPVVTSCGTGMTACVLSLGLVLAGLKQGAMYDGSWTEWGGREDVAVER